MRKLATVRMIDAIEPIENADQIEAAKIGGWVVVVKKGQFRPTDRCVYIEIDSLLPVSNPEFAFLEGKRLRTKKLRGVVSQGICFPMSILPKQSVYYSIDQDVTAELGITKYEPNPEPKEETIKIPKFKGNFLQRTYKKYRWQFTQWYKKVTGQQLVKEPFPSFIPKTDEERVQNLGGALKHWGNKAVFITEKLDGSSITIFCKKKRGRWVTGVCSRNLQLPLKDNNNFCNAARESMAILALENYCKINNRELAIQGELIGPGIQGNKYELDKHQIYFFTAFDIASQSRLPSYLFLGLFKTMGLNTVPFIHTALLVNDIQHYLTLADGKSKLNPKVDREGLVIRSLEDAGKQQFSFKAISNKWLLQEK